MTHRVDLYASGANDGTSWVNAFTDLQVAIDAAVNDDQIWVKGYTDPLNNYYYPPSGSNYFNLNGKNLKIFGGFKGTEVNLSQRIFWNQYVSKLGPENNTGRIIVLNGSNATLDGFTISGTTDGAPIVLGGTGKTQLLSNLVITDCKNVDAVTTTEKCIILIEGGNSTVKMFNVAITNNKFPNVDGALIRCLLSNLEMYNVTIAFNNRGLSPIGTAISTYSPLTPATNVLNIYNTIIWQTGGYNNTGNTTGTIKNSLVQSISSIWTPPLTNGGNNLDTNPLFVYPVAPTPPLVPNFNLQPSSPAINQGDVSDYKSNYPYTPAGVYYSDFDVEAKPRFDYEPNTWEELIDMGAYQHISSPSPSPALSIEEIEQLLMQKIEENTTEETDLADVSEEIVIQ